MRNFILSIFLVLSGFCFGQNPYTISIDKTSGLPSNSVYDIFQDSKGFMWFATGKGLCRFDGMMIKQFISDNQTSKSGSCIQEDKYGRIWYENFDGFLYYVANNKLNSFETAESCGYFKYGIIDNSLFKLQRKSVKIFNLKNLNLDKEVKTNFNNIQFTFSTDHAFYVLEDKLHEFDKNGFKRNISLPPNFKTQFPSPIIERYKDGFILFSKYNNQYLIFSKGKFTKHFINYPVGFIQNSAVFGTEIWICTPKGVLQINPENNKVLPYFTDQSIAYIFKDKQHNYWVATLSNGVHFIDDFTTQLFAFNTTPYSLSHDKNNLIIGTEKDEILHFDLITKKASTLYKGNSNHPVNPLYTDTTARNTMYFTSSKFNIFKSGKLLLEEDMALKDLIRLDGKYIAFAATNNSGLIVTNASATSDWDYYLKGNKQDKNSNFTTTNLVTNANGKSVAYNASNKTLYFATNRGLFQHYKNTQREILHQGKSIYILKLKQYKNVIYGLTSVEKIVVIDASNQLTPLLMPEEFRGLKFENIKIQDSSLYLFTSEGVIEHNLEQNTFSTVLSLTKEMNITDLSVFKNQLFFATSQGLLIKHKKQNRLQSSPKLIINTLSINDKEIDVAKENTFDYKQNNLKIDFSIISYIPNQKQSLLYQINDSKWYKLESNSRVLNLISLSPDTYKIALKTDEKNNNSPVLFSFTIAKPFWQTNLFLLLVILLGFGIIYSLYRIKLKEIKRKNQLVLDKVNLEKNLNQSKLKALKSQMNPHFFYNALNTLQSYILANDKREAVNYLSKFSTLTRTILEMTEKEMVILSDEIKTLTLYLDIEKSRFDADFTFECIVDSQLDTDNIKIPSMLLQPYVENAVKHGLLHKEGIKTLKLSFEKAAEFVQVSIEDNGIGRKKSGELNAIKNKKHTSFATTAIQTRIDLLNSSVHQKITVRFEDKTNTNQQATGTIVFFKIPIIY